jgi:hypothetical protein
LKCKKPLNEGLSEEKEGLTPLIPDGEPAKETLRLLQSLSFSVFKTTPKVNFWCGLENKKPETYVSGFFCGERGSRTFNISVNSNLPNFLYL